MMAGVHDSVVHSASETELSDTESAHQVITLSSPEDCPPVEVEKNVKNTKDSNPKSVSTPLSNQKANSEQKSEKGDPKEDQEEEDEDDDDDDDDPKEEPDNDHSASNSDSSAEYVVNCNLRGPSTRHDVRKAERLILDLMSSSKLVRIPEESDEQYVRRVRKHNYLSMAQEFVARHRNQAAAGDRTDAAELEMKNLKNRSKCPVSDLPVSDLPVQSPVRPCNFESVGLKRGPQASASAGVHLRSSSSSMRSLIHAPHTSFNQNAIHRHHQRSLAEYDALNCLLKNNAHCNRQEPGLGASAPAISHERHSRNSTGHHHPCRSMSLGMEHSAVKPPRNALSDLPANVAKMAARYMKPVNFQHHHPRENADKGFPANMSVGAKKCAHPLAPVEDKDFDSYKNTKVPSPSMEILGSFDVYNIETAMPTIDWAAMEEHLTKAAKEELLFHKYRNTREEIRRKLAMGGDSEEFYGGEKQLRKPSLQSRLQSGMNLQICFMNDTVTDSEGVTASASETIHEGPIKPVGPMMKPVNLSLASKKAIPEFPASETVVPKKSSTATTVEETTNSVSKQAKLQAEARIALAQAKQMAHMQIEVEKQRKKKSPIAEMVGIPFPDGRHKVSRHALSEMNVAQLQVIVNDLHTQIESLNEELVRLLLERDDLHMEQDSMLVDVEDLTRYL